MTGSFTSIIRMVGLLVVFCVSKHALSTEVLAVEGERCIAAPSADAFTRKHEVSPHTSELCFTRLEELTGTLEQLVLIDVASGANRGQIGGQSGGEKSPLAITPRQLKTKHFLKRKSLLLLSEPYKRHSMAQLCQELVQSGFENPKILIGKRPQGLFQEAHLSVSANDYLVELSHFGVVTVAANSSITQELTQLGIPVISNQTDQDLETTVRNAFISYSLNGYLPIFIVGETEQEKRLEKQLRRKFTEDVFVVTGGVEAIKRALRNGALGAVKRAGLDGVPGCAG
ncbi:hypothetical protein [Microbulbifer epialgicus]|uniref:Uncharacterized protein n=1 Tax=Microbulbifer epialgicus TaxID=393907 RepID=A0ABV4NXZ9_9GAMM